MVNGSSYTRRGFRARSCISVQFRCDGFNMVVSGLVRTEPLGHEVGGLSSLLCLPRIRSRALFYFCDNTFLGYVLPRMILSFS